MLITLRLINWPAIGVSISIDWSGLQFNVTRIQKTMDTMTALKELVDFCRNGSWALMRGRNITRRFRYKPGQRPLNEKTTGRISIYQHQSSIYIMRANGLCMARSQIPNYPANSTVVATIQLMRYSRKIASTTPQPCWNARWCDGKMQLAAVPQSASRIIIIKSSTLPIFNNMLIIISLVWFGLVWFGRLLNENSA
jgi:hypothetical protein